MIALIDIEKAMRLLSEYIDPYEIPGAGNAIMESLIELEFVEEEHNDTATIDLSHITGCGHMGY